MGPQDGSPLTAVQASSRPGHQTVAKLRMRYTCQGKVGVIQKKRSNGTGNPEVLIEGEAAVSDWSWDGRFIVYEYFRPSEAVRTCGYYLCSAIASPFRFYKQSSMSSLGDSLPMGAGWLIPQMKRGEMKCTSRSFPPSGAKVAGLNQRRWMAEMAARWQRVVLSGLRSEAHGGGREWRRYALRLACPRLFFRHVRLLAGTRMP